MCITEPQIHLPISLLLILGSFQGNFCFRCSSFILIIKFFGLIESQVAGNKLVILSREGFSYRESDAYELAGRFKGAVSLLGLQKGLPEQEESGPSKNTGTSVTLGRGTTSGSSPGTTESGTTHQLGLQDLRAAFAATVGPTPHSHEVRAREDSFTFYYPPEAKLPGAEHASDATAPNCSHRSQVQHARLPLSGGSQLCSRLRALPYSTALTTLSSPSPTGPPLAFLLSMSPSCGDDSSLRSQYWTYYLSSFLIPFIMQPSLDLLYGPDFYHPINWIFAPKSYHSPNRCHLYETDRINKKYTNTTFTRKCW